MREARKQSRGRTRRRGDDRRKSHLPMETANGSLPTELGGRRMGVGREHRQSTKVDAAETKLDVRPPEVANEVEKGRRQRRRIRFLTGERRGEERCGESAGRSDPAEKSSRRGNAGGGAGDRRSGGKAKKPPATKGSSVASGPNVQSTMPAQQTIRPK